MNTPLDACLKVAGVPAGTLVFSSKCKIINTSRCYAKLLLSRNQKNMQCLYVRLANDLFSSKGMYGEINLSINLQGPGEFFLLPPSAILLS